MSVQTMFRSVVGGLRTPLRSLVDRYPILGGPIGRAWNTYERSRFAYYAWRNARRFREEPASIDPYQTIQTPPASIDGHSPGGFDFIMFSGAVIDGNWDRPGVARFEDRFRYPSFRTHFIDGVPWEETEFYNMKVNKINSDREAKYASVEALDRKCEELDRMYTEMRTNGYKSQTEIQTTHGTAGSIIGDGGRGFFPGSHHLVRNEVAIDIARDGEPMLNEGRHRTCLAKLLDLETIPVRVVVRHREWQELRNQVVQLVQNQQPDNRTVAHELIEAEVPALRKTVLGVEHPDICSVVDGYFDKQ